MKKTSIFLIAILLTAAMFAGCGRFTDTQVPETQMPTGETALPTDAPTEAPTEAPAEAPTEATTESVPETTEEDIVYEGDATSYYTDIVYAEQIGRYHIALSEKWEEEKYFENGMSVLPSYYYDGNPLNNVGFGFADLDNDGRWELIIGAILNAERDPAVFEIWTLVDGEPVMLAQASSQNRYILQYAQEERMWYVVNETTNTAASHATYYLMLNDGKFEIMQGILFDATADEQNPWFMTYDLDWDISNDEPIDEETANAILDSNRMQYTALEYLPYIFY